MSESTPHVTYCSNIHPGESWAETLANIRHRATEVKALVRPDAPMGLGLRLSARAARELLAEPVGLEALRTELDELGLYVFTLNGFPYGSFHAAPVKEAVYRPDWRTAERVTYTDELVRILAALLPGGVGGSISTVPVGFRAEIAADASAVARSVEGLLACAETMWRLREARGIEIALAIEPEPACHLETTEEALRFVQQVLLGNEGVERFAQRTGLAARDAEDALRRHLGLCLDTCHAAVAFEEPRATVRAIEAAGVRIAKVQATTGLHAEPVDEVRQEALQRFADPIYLHQVVAQCRDAQVGVVLERFVDLDEALASLARGAHRPTCWRVHYHVPIFERELAPFTNTQEFLAEALDEVLARRLCAQIEVETYTWSVLPERYRRQALSEMIAGELRWVDAAVAARGETA
ncbi:MAG: metabolite traffic protein EboE [Polyangiales bacterium]